MITKNTVAHIWTEGKTDWIILKKAEEALGLQLQISYNELTQEMGDEKLLGILQTFAQKSNPEPLIFIFDHDNQHIIETNSLPNTNFKSWGNNVFSFVISIPDNIRPSCESFSIEMYFSDQELLRKDRQGRRLFLSNEFNEKSGNHQTDSTIHLVYPGIVKGHTNAKRLKIIDANVFDSNGNNIALSKSDFATYVADGVAPFQDLNFQNFIKIFNIIQEIIEQTRPRHNIFLPDYEPFFSDLEAKDLNTQFLKTFNLFVDTVSLALYLFSISTIRYYEDIIVNEPEILIKKVIPIKKIVTDAFREPSLNTLTELAKKCFFLVDDNAPPGLIEMKKCLAQNIVLEEIGQMLDDLDQLFPKQHGEYRMRAGLRRDILMEIIPTFAQIASMSRESLDEGIECVSNFPDLQLTTWKIANQKLANYLKPIFSFPILFREIKNYDHNQEHFILSVKKYHVDFIEEYEENAKKESEEFEMKASELSLDETHSIHIYPFLMVHNDALFMYKRTNSASYLYYSPALNEYYLENNKKKFSHSIFKIGSKQELFWTDVLPYQNPHNGIKANIPEEGPSEFIGRRKQIRKIREEIIEIVNENGILYGLGGIGKTSLMI